MTNYNRTNLGNGICEDENNIVQCQFDGNDCCPKYVNDKCNNDTSTADGEDKCNCKSGNNFFK